MSAILSFKKNLNAVLGNLHNARRIEACESAVAHPTHLHKYNSLYYFKEDEQKEFGIVHFRVRRRDKKTAQRCGHHHHHHHVGRDLESLFVIRVYRPGKIPRVLLKELLNLASGGVRNDILEAYC